MRTHLVRPASGGGCSAAHRGPSALSRGLSAGTAAPAARLCTAAPAPPVARHRTQDFAWRRALPLGCDGKGGYFSAEPFETVKLHHQRIRCI